MTTREAIPKSWIDHLGNGSLGLGTDLATTEKGTSNPSALAVTEQVGQRYLVRLLLAWKTADPDVTTAIIGHVLDDIAAANCRPKKLSIDASNEVFFATALKKKFQNKCPVILVKGGEKVKYKGEEFAAKTLLGNLYVNAIEDGLVSLPDGDFIRDDHRLVNREKGTFTTETGKNGQHGDTFDAVKHSIWALLVGGGRVQANAVDITGGNKPKRPGLIGPIGRAIKQTFLNT